MRRREKRALALAVIPFAALWLFAGVSREGGAVGSGSQPRELGQVHWERDYDSAVQRAGETEKPLFLLFQEVPGCQTCVSFGDEVLGHPLLVEAIENEFEAVAVYNNKGGPDARVLALFDEPAWNNPVVRFIDADGKDLVPRAAGVWKPHALGTRMIAALEAAGRPVPSYLSSVVDELRPRRAGRATFAMHCFWTGEACLGALPGLLSSRAGFFASREVVELRFDPAAISYREIVREARRRGCADTVYAHDEEQERVAREIFGPAVQRVAGIARDAGTSDQKRALRKGPLAGIELTPRQALQANAAVAGGRSPARYLSPRQRAEAGLSHLRSKED